MYNLVQHKTLVFLRNTRGSIALLSAIFIPIFVLAAFATIEFSQLKDSERELKYAADAASLAAVIKAQQLVEGDDGVSVSEAIREAIKDAEKLFDQLPEDLKNSPKIELEYDDGKFTAKVTYNHSVNSLFGDFLYGEYQLTGTSTSGSTTTERVVPFMEVELLLDVSSSMGIGATTADIQLLKDNLNCEFACHRNNVTEAHAFGATMRIDVLRDATNRLVDAAEDATKGKEDDPTNVKIGVNTFDTTFIRLHDISDNLSRVRSSIDGVRLATSGKATDIGGSIRWLNSWHITDGGSGDSEDSPKKFVFIVSDGVDNHKLFEPSVCNILKDRNITVGVIYVEYVEFNDVAGHFNRLVKPYHHLIPGTLRTCATENFYIQATTPEEIDKAMADIFKKALIETRELVRITE